MISPLERRVTGEHPVGTGLLFYVMGRAAAGRGRVLAFARRALRDCDRVRFIDRVTTVPVPSEPSDERVDPVCFEQLVAADAFAFTWRSTEGRFGVRRELDDWLTAGVNVVLTGSRFAFEHALQRYRDLIAVYVRGLGDPERLEDPDSDPREQTAILQRRLQRPGPRLESPQLISIGADGRIEQAGERLVHLVQGRRSG